LPEDVRLRDLENRQRNYPFFTDRTGRRILRFPYRIKGSFPSLPEFPDAGEKSHPSYPHPDFRFKKLIEQGLPFPSFHFRTSLSLPGWGQISHGTPAPVHQARGSLDFGVD